MKQNFYENFSKIEYVLILVLSTSNHRRKTSSLQQDDILHFNFLGRKQTTKQLRPTVPKTQAIHQQLGEDLETSIGPLNLKASEPLGTLSGGEVEVVEVGGWLGFW